MKNTPWNFLPIEISEKILLDVPVACMFYNKPWVCKSWTCILLQPVFWIRKLRRIGFTIEEEVESGLKAFERKIQVACLYHACLNEKMITIEIEENDYDEIPFEDSNIKISDDIQVMLKAAGNLITSEVNFADLILYKEKMPILPVLLKLLALRKCCVQIYDHYGFWNFAPRYEFVQMLKGPYGVANIMTLIGCVSSLSGITESDGDEPQDYLELKLSIAVDEHNKAIDPGIHTKIGNLRLLHIKAGSEVFAFKQVGHLCSTCIISGLESTHTSWMIDLAKKFGLYFSYNLVLISCQMNKCSIIQLFHSWCGCVNNPCDIMCASSTLNANDVLELNDLAWKLGLSRKYNFFILCKSDEKLITTSRMKRMMKFI